jgi:hypothetical protein
MKIIDIALLAAVCEAKNKRPVYKSIANRPFDSSIMKERSVNERHYNNIKGERHPVVTAPQSANYQCIF